MQPRSRFSPPRCTVFHVTNSGCSSTSAASSLLFCFDLPNPKKLLRLLLAELASDALDGVEATLGKDEDEDVAGEGATRRDMAGLLRVSGSESEGKGSSSERGFPLFHCFQRETTSDKVRLGVLVRVEERVSKQKAQWAWVAMLGVDAGCL